MLARYRQTPVEQIGCVILSNHPYVKLWEEAAPYVLQYNQSYLHFQRNAGNFLRHKI
jgi:hypothetical protein